jgi:hypothetical protein
VFGKRVPRRIFLSKTDEVTGSYRKLHNEELHNLHYSPSIIRIIKSGRMSGTGHVACMERRRTHRGFWRESQNEGDH